MAEKSRRLDYNVAGAYYVDDQCINCGVCMEIAPDIFKSNDDEGFAYVAAQPKDAEATDMARDALESCPVESIGDDG
jgi:ferredoxin